MRRPELKSRAGRSAARPVSASTIRKAAEGIIRRLIWRIPIAPRFACPDVAPRRHAAEGRKQHGRHRDAEQALREHVDAKGVVDRAWRLPADERAEDRVDQLVEVDDAEPDRDRQHQYEDLASRAGRASRGGTEPVVDLPQRRAGHHQLHNRRHKDRDGIGVDAVI